MLVEHGIGLGCLRQGKTVRDETGRSHLLQHPPGDLEPTRFAPAACPLRCQRADLTTDQAHAAAVKPSSQVDVSPLLPIPGADHHPSAKPRGSDRLI